MTLIEIEKQVEKIFERKDSLTFFVDAINYSFPLLSYVAFNCKLEYKEVCCSPLFYLYRTGVKEINNKIEKLFEREEPPHDLTVLASLGFLSYCTKNNVSELDQRKSIRLLNTIDKHIRFQNDCIVSIRYFPFDKKIEIKTYSEFVVQVNDYLRKHTTLPKSYRQFLNNRDTLYKIVFSMYPTVATIFNSLQTANCPKL